MQAQPSIGHYRIVSKLGEGGMGAVYRATDTKLSRDVAIKVLPEVFAQDTARMAPFEREAGHWLAYVSDESGRAEVSGAWRQVADLERWRR